MIFLIFIAACTFNEPVLPNWLTVWELPIPDVNFEMSEAVDDEYIFADSTVAGGISLSIKDSVDKKSMSEEDLSIKPDPDTLSNTIENISISSPGTESSAPYSIQQLVPFQINVISNPG